MLAAAAVDGYLARIGYRGPRQATAETLAALHLAHLLAVPFENLSIHAGEPIELEPAWLYDKIVTRRRGGFCYELNGLFAELLEGLGFPVDRLAARGFGDGGQLGIPFDHLCLRVEAGGAAWLADVGFGDCFVRPLRLDRPGEQHDGRRSFRIVEDGDRRIVEDAGVPAYRFELDGHPLAAFAGGCHHHQTSPASPFTRRRVVSLLTEPGRITLRDQRLITTGAAGDKHETPVAGPAEWRAIAADRFGLPAQVLAAAAPPPVR